MKTLFSVITNLSDDYSISIWTPAAAIGIFWRTENFECLRQESRDRGHIALVKLQYKCETL